MNLKNGVFHGKPAYRIAILILLATLVLSLLWAVTIGSVDLAMGDVYRVILYKIFGIGDPEVYGKGSLSDIVWFVRLPRLVLAIALQRLRWVKYALRWAGVINLGSVMVVSSYFIYQACFLISKAGGTPLFVCVESWC